MGLRKVDRLLINSLIGSGFGLLFWGSTAFADGPPAVVEQDQEDAAKATDVAETSPEAGIGSEKTTLDDQKEDSPQPLPAGEESPSSDSPVTAEGVTREKPPGEGVEALQLEPPAPNASLTPTQVDSGEELGGETADTEGALSEGALSEGALSEGAPNQPKLSSKMLVVWSLVAGSGVTLVTGGVFGMAALEERSRYEDTPHRDFEDRVRARAITADVFLGVAAATAAIALIYYFVADDSETAKKVSLSGRDPGGHLGNLTIHF